MATKIPKQRKKADAPQWTGKLYKPSTFGGGIQGMVEWEQNRRRERREQREYRTQEKRLEERDALYPAEPRDRWPIFSPHFWPFRVVRAVARFLTRR